MGGHGSVEEWRLFWFFIALIFVSGKTKCAWMWVDFFISFFGLYVAKLSFSSFFTLGGNVRLFTHSNVAHHSTKINCRILSLISQQDLDCELQPANVFNTLLQKSSSLTHPLVASSHTFTTWTHRFNAWMHTLTPISTNSVRYRILFMRSRIDLMGYRILWPRFPWIWCDVAYFWCVHAWIWCVIAHFDPESAPFLSIRQERGRFVRFSSM